MPLTRWPACRAACPTGRRSTGRTRGCSRRSCRRRWRSRGATRRSPRGRQTLQTSLRPRALRRWRTRWSWCGPPWRAARTGRRRTSERRRKRKRREREEKDEEKREEKKGENERMRKEVLKEKKKGASWPTFQFASSHFCFLFPHLRFSLSRARASQLASSRFTNPPRWRARCCSHRPPVSPPLRPRSPRRPARSRGEACFLTIPFFFSCLSFFSALISLLAPLRWLLNSAPANQEARFRTRCIRCSICHTAKGARKGQREMQFRPRARESAFASPLFSFLSSCFCSPCFPL